MQTYNIEVGDTDKYDLIKFPGGELHVRVKEDVMAAVSDIQTVSVTARITNAEKLIETFLVIDAVRQESGREITLILPYLPYARADRRFSAGDCFGIASFARLINSADVMTFTLDAHSAAGLVHFEHIRDLPSTRFIEHAYEQFKSDHIQTKSGADSNKNESSKSEEDVTLEDVTLLFPDKGARERYASAGEQFAKVLHCSKERDLLTGKLKGFKVPEKAEFTTRKVLIVDDICDGGGTFTGIADGLKEYELDLALYVTHGLFSKGMGELNKHFSHVFTTNSFATDYSTLKDYDDSRLTTFPTEDFFREHVTATTRTR